MPAKYIYGSSQDVNMEDDDENREISRPEM